ncbi:hypothetical protein Cs7R123_46260 [Catellatospora sp. TT07R-123]|uniref:tautomerase family protein n=1 Tax=Catellatospora sp. TT07R-123 TaxID=2733863 RepID=UPI001B242437|nr:tautomerase family protein [Catellatospora sp. TT07R-123]GHJ47284.1 hypothetical protein Cs7R123_46260 [Catellatospora sp. TT07R-123]
MPLWNVYHTPGVFTAEQKRRLAARITESYEAIGLPRFYVMTLFHETRPEDFFVGGEPASVAVRVVIDHIARHNPDQDSRRRTARWVEEILRLDIADIPGVHWEFHVDETSEDLWMINGLVPPPGGSEAERLWARNNATSPY